MYAGKIAIGKHCKRASDDACPHASLFVKCSKLSKSTHVRPHVRFIYIYVSCVVLCCMHVGKLRKFCICKNVPWKHALQTNTHITAAGRRRGGARHPDKLLFVFLIQLCDDTHTQTRVHCVHLYLNKVCKNVVHICGNVNELIEVSADKIYCFF